MKISDMCNNNNNSHVTTTSISNNRSSILHTFTSVWMFLLGMSFVVSTGLQSISMVFVITMALLHPHLLGNIKLSLKQPFVKACLIFYALFILGVSWSNAPTKDILSMLLKLDPFLWVVVVFALLYDVGYKKMVYYGFGFGVILANMSSIISWFSLNDFFGEYGIHWTLYGKDYHIFPGHTYQIFFTGLLISGVLGIILNTKVTTTNLSRATLLGYIGIIILGLVDCFVVLHGRGGQVLLLIMLILLLLQWNLRVGMALSAVVLLVCLPLVIYFSPSIQYSIKNTQSDLTQYKQGNLETSIGSRLEFHRISKILIANAPFIGHGTGSYKSEYVKLQRPNTFPSTNPHNDYFWCAVELGLVGVVALLGIIITGIYQGYLLTTVPQRHLAIILVVTYALSCLQNSFFTDRITAEAFIVLISCLLAVKSKPQ